MNAPSLRVVLALALLPAVASAQQDLSTGGSVETDLWVHEESPPAALLDGDVATHYAQHRLEDSDWRVWLASPGVPTQATFVQGWADWSQVVSLRLETAYGETETITLETGTRDEQAFPLPFTEPTAFVDVYIVSALPSGSGEGYGGFAELRIGGTPVDPGLGTLPLVTDVAVAAESETVATVSWTTDRPTSSQVRYSTDSECSTLTSADLALVTSHSVRIEAAAPLRGQIEIRSADEAGYRAEVRHDAFTTVDTSRQYGVGGWSFEIGGEWIPATELYASDELAVRFSQAWIGGSGWTDWFGADDVRNMVDAGLTPDIIHYFFGDPELADVQARSPAFLADIQTLADLLAESGVGEQVIVTLEPEFNQGDVARWEGWNDLMIQAIDILRNTAGAKVGVLPGDWDIDHVLPISMGRAAAHSDFVAYQEMRASTQDERADALAVPDRAVRFSHYLSRKFLRPVRLGYLMVSDYGGWADVQRDVVVAMCERADELEAAGTYALSWMSYLDHPGSDGYFGEGEAHKGLKYADNTPKPAWHVFKECAANGASWLETGEPPPGAIAPVASGADAGCGCRSTGDRRRGARVPWIGPLVVLSLGLRRRARRVRSALQR